MSASGGLNLKLSIVVPVYSGADYLERLVIAFAELFEALKESATGVELLETIFVLDDPVDGSREVLEELNAVRPWMRLVVLSRNFGQHSATVAGILHSSGDWIVTMDEDLQHPPGAIPALLAHVSTNGSDVLYATPEGGTHQGFFRDSTSRLAKRSIAWLTGNQHVSDFSSFRLIRGSVARAAGSVCSDQTYFDMTLLWFTNRFAKRSMALQDHRHQQTGNSGYSVPRLLTHAKRLLFSSDVHFFRLALTFSGIILAFAVGLLTWVLVGYWLAPEDFDKDGWASLMSVNLFFGGTLAILLGLVLEFARTGLFHGQGKPAFFVVDRSTDGVLREAASQLEALSEQLLREKGGIRQENG